MPENTKGRSPFYPGQPVPVELFTGRSDQIRRINNRGVAQVADGKPVTMYIQGEYGIGKSSIANFTRALAEKRSGLHGIYVTLGGANSLEDVAATILESVVRSGAFDPSRSERIRNWLARYVGKQQLFGFTINAEALRRDAPNIASPYGLLSLLKETTERLADTGVKGIFLVLDEINGITKNPQFSHFIKGLVDTNANAKPPIPLLLMVCGVEERRMEMIRHHPPVGRIFDVIQIDPMDDGEMRDFFKRAFGSVKMTVDLDAMDLITYYSGGLPKIMHEIGDAAYYVDKDDRIDIEDARTAVNLAADEVGRKYVEHEVYDALKSKAYHSILSKLARLGTTEFTRDELAASLNEDEIKKLDKFLRRMRDIKVIRQGDSPGEYIFNIRMYQVYIQLKTIRAEPVQGQARRPKRG